MSETEELASVRELSRKYLDDGGLQYLLDKDGHLVLPFGNIMVHVICHQWGEDQVVVAVTAVTNQNMRIDPDLGMFLAEKNAQILFGKLCLYRDLNQVRFEHPLLGDFLNRDELVTAVKVVAASALSIGPEIQQRWGGI